MGRIRNPVKAFIFIYLLCLKVCSFSKIDEDEQDGVKIRASKRSRGEKSSLACSGRKRACFDENDLDFIKSRISEYIENDFFDGFKSYFKHIAHGRNAEDLNDIIGLIVAHDEPIYAFYLMEGEGYEIDFKSSKLKRSHLKAAIFMKKTEVVLSLLKNSENEDFEFAFEAATTNRSLTNAIHRLQVSRPGFVPDLKNTSASIIFDKISISYFRYEHFRRTSSSNGSVLIPIFATRQTVLQSAFTASVQHSQSWYSGFHRLFIIFDNENGIDHGGLTYEWLELLLEGLMSCDGSRVFSPRQVQMCGSSSSSQSCQGSSYEKGDIEPLLDFSKAFFISNSNGIYVPNLEYPAKYFEFVGSVLALAFLYNTPCKVDFIPAMYRMLLLEKSSDSVWAQDLQVLDLSAFNSIHALRNISVDLSSISGLEATGFKSVNRENLEQFIQSKSKDLAFLPFKDHLSALQNGFVSVLDLREGEFSKLRLSSVDLRKLMFGDLVIPAEDFIKYSDTRQMFNTSNKEWLFEIIREMDDSERILLFKFITGRRGVPFKGIKNLPNPLKFASILEEDAKHLPAASTCSCLMKIPTYSTKSIMKDKLLMAIKSCDTFNLE